MDTSWVDTSRHFYLPPFKKLLLSIWISGIVLPKLVHSVPPGMGMMKEKQPGWVRFCSGDDYYDVFANQCPAGFFWKSDFQSDKKWDCVCARGPWRRSNKWCSKENTQRFTQGDISCFEPDSKENLEGMLYLGDQYSAWDSGTPILLTSFTSGVTIRQEDFSQKWKLPTRNNDDPGILISRPREDWTVEDQNNPKLRLCLRAPPPTFDDTVDGIYIYNISMLLGNGVDTEFKLAFTRTCFSWDKDDGKKWYEIIGESIDDKNLIVPAYENSTASDACGLCMKEPIPEAPKIDVYGVPLKPSETRTMEDLKHVGVLTSEINLQTERLGLYWANRLLRDETDYVKENLQEVEILTKAAIMAYGTCNMNFVPKQFYQYFLLMFRRLLSESFKKYAPASPITPEYYTKIEELLNKCMLRTKKIQFMVDKSCPPMYQGYKSEEGNTTIPKGKTDYYAKPAKHDYLLEFIWRLKSFLHYNCFPEFREDSVLHDLMQNQLEALFTEDILLRWFNPSKAFKMYEYIFKVHLDLKATMGNFERCVRVVHQVSKYPVWLTRPIDQPHRIHFMSRKKRSAETDPKVEDAVSWENEYEDMAIATIRQKRLGDTEAGGEKTEATDEETTKAEGSEEKATKEDAPESGEGDTKIEEGSDAKTDDTEGASIKLDLRDNSKEDETKTKADQTGDATTENPEDEDAKTENPEDGDAGAGNPEDGDSKTETPEVEDPETAEAQDELKERDAEDNKQVSDTATDDKDSKKGDSKDKRKDSNGMLTYPDEESSEMMYTDSSEARGNRDEATQTVWNMFTVPGSKGFVGACIESMSTFTELENKDMATCW